MSTLRVSFSKIKLDKEKFTKEMERRTSHLLMVAGYAAFEQAMWLVPVWTGESRGGLRGLARLFDKSLGIGKNGIEQKLMFSIKPVKENFDRRNHRGATKTPTSAHVAAAGPIRRVGNRLDVFFMNDADGFSVADKHAQKNTGPWGFSLTLRRKWAQNFKILAAETGDIPLKSFSSTQRVVADV